MSGLLLSPLLMMMIASRRWASGFRAAFGLAGAAGAGGWPGW